jgi:PHP family Zn ribbon phosphoesterase
MNKEWNTQENCKVEFETLPDANKQTMIEIAERLFDFKLLRLHFVSKNKCNHKWRVPLMYNKNNQNNPTDCVKCGEMIRDISMF